MESFLNPQGDRVLESIREKLTKFVFFYKSEKLNYLRGYNMFK